jgi:hypothetical protein
MTLIDLPAVMATAAQVHPGYPEDEAVFAERLALAPQGCLCLERERPLAGYVVSHPWLLGSGSGAEQPARRAARFGRRGLVHPRSRSAAAAARQRRGR